MSADRGARSGFCGDGGEFRRRGFIRRARDAGNARSALAAQCPAIPKHVSVLIYNPHTPSTYPSARGSFSPSAPDVSDPASGSAMCGCTPSAQWSCHSRIQPSFVWCPRCAPDGYPSTIALTTVLSPTRQYHNPPPSLSGSPVVPDSHLATLAHQVHREIPVVAPSFAGGVSCRRQTPKPWIVHRVARFGDHFVPRQIRQRCDGRHLSSKQRNETQSNRIVQNR